MTRIGNVRFWLDGWMLRSSNYETHSQPFEAGISKHWELPGLQVYESVAECGGTELRLSSEFLWFYINVFLFHTSRQTRRWDDSERYWGFYFMGRTNFVLRWAKRYWSFDIPFISLVFVKQELMSLDRARVVRGGCNFLTEDYQAYETAKRENSVTLPYRYETLRGDAQDVKATVWIERWTRKWKWTPFKQVCDSIWVEFSEEVGAGRGSWKGGVTGCGWDMLPGESAIQCLRRMERERRFDR